MRRALIILTVLAMALAACGGDGAEDAGGDGAVPEDWPEEIVFGFVPSQEQTELQDDIEPFIAVLEEALGIDVEGFVTTDYTGLATAMGTGSADVGAFGPFGYVTAKQQFPDLEVLLQSIRFGSPTYHGQWFTNDPSLCDAEPVAGAFENVDGVPTLKGPTETVALQVGWTPDDEPETLDDGTPVDPGLACEADLAEVIEGKTVAFVSEGSTSGYVFPVLQLIDLGIDPDADINANFFGGHDGAVTAVYNGDADIGVSYDDARREIRETNPDVGSQVIVFDLTPEVPNDVVVVRGDLPDSLKDAIYDAIADYLETDEGKEVFDEIYEWTSVRRAQDSDFDVVRQAAEELGITED